MIDFSLAAYDQKRAQCQALGGDLAMYQTFKEQQMVGGWAARSYPDKYTWMEQRPEQPRHTLPPACDHSKAGPWPCLPLALPAHMALKLPLPA